MPIQFPCTQCGASIEVDDDLAGRAVTCPYCEKVTAAPARPALARPVAPAGAPSLPPLGAAAPAIAGVDPNARRLGTYGMICSALAITCFVTLAVAGMSIILDAPVDVRSDPERLQRYLQERVEGGDFPQILFPAMGMGMTFFALAGLTLGVLNLTRSRGRDWTGWAAVVGGAGLSLLFCGALAMTAIAGKMPTGP